MDYEVTRSLTPVSAFNGRLEVGCEVIILNRSTGEYHRQCDNDVRQQGMHFKSTGAGDVHRPLPAPAVLVKSA